MRARYGASHPGSASNASWTSLSNASGDWPATTAGYAAGNRMWPRAGRGLYWPANGVWRSLVAHPAGGRAVGGSNPLAPITQDHNPSRTVVGRVGEPLAGSRSAGLLPAAGALFVVAGFLAYDPFYLPNLRRFSEEGLSGWWI